MNLGRKLLLVAGGLCAGLLLAELGLQLASRFLPPKMDLLRRPPPVTLSDPRLGTRPNPEFRDRDAAGFRNTAVPSEAFVVAMGDSQTYGTGVDRAENWPHQLQSLTGRSVYGISCGGWGPTQSLLLVDRALALRPRLVVEAFYAGNDLFDSFEKALNVRRKRRKDPARPVSRAWRGSPRPRPSSARSAPGESPAP